MLLKKNNQMESLQIVTEFYIMWYRETDPWLLVIYPLIHDCHSSDYEAL